MFGLWKRPLRPGCVSTPARRYRDHDGNEDCPNCRSVLYKPWTDGLRVIWSCGDCGYGYAAESSTRKVEPETYVSHHSLNTGAIVRPEGVHAGVHARVHEGVPEAAGKKQDWP